MRRLSLLLLLPAVAGVVWGVSFWKEVHRPPAIEIPASSDGFWVAQQQFSRVREAWRDKGAGIVDTLAEHGLATNDLNILLVAFKDEGQLQLYGKHQAEDKFRLLKTFGIVRKSGELGPKWQEGDKQVPEGFYRIDRFNPKSSYHLSLGLDYPNAADRKRSQAEKLGGDIFIHGSIRTVGCLPITDDKIKELYLYAVLAKENGQKDIPVYVFPFAMNEANQTQFSRRYAERPDLLAFWQNLRQGYVRFVQTQQALKWQATENGEYRIGE